MNLMSSAFELAPNQRRLVTIQGDGAVRVCVAAVDVKGALDRQKLEVALKAAMGSLPLPLAAERAPEERGVASAVSLELVAADTRVSRDDAMYELMERELRAAREVDAAPALRAVLLQLASHDHVLVLSLPSLVTDAQSLCRFVEMILARYSGQEPEVAELQYSQYVTWQNDILAEQDADAMAFWRSIWTLSSPTAALPFQRNQRAEPFRLGVASVHRSGARGRSSRTLPAELLVLALRWGVEPAALLTAAWAALVARWTGEDEIVLGWVDPARCHEPLRLLQGLVAKTIPLKLRVRQDMTLQQLAVEVGEALAPARDWMDHFRWSVESTPFAPEPAECYLSAAFEYEDVHLAVPASAGVTARMTGLAGASDRFVIKLSCIEQEGGIYADVVYDAGLVDASSAGLAARMLSDLLGSLLERPEASLSEHVLLRDAERMRSVGRAWAEAPKSVIEMFESCAAKAPSVRALAHGDRNISYGELRASVRRLSSLLRRDGVGPEVVVAVAAERSVEAIVAILAILGAGGAFVPIDPSYPAHRIAFMVKDSGAAMVLGSRRHRDAFSGTRYIALDEEAGACEHECADEPLINSDPNALAYVIYTSGSTGTPKGCQVEVRNLSHYVSWANEHYFGSGAVEGHFGLFTSLSFDLTLMSIFCPLTRGKTLRIYDASFDTLDALRDMFSESSDVDVVNMTPSHISLVGTLGLSRTNVRMVVTGGEQLTKPQVSLLQALNPAIEIHNEYGPTEATVGCLTKKVEDGDDRIVIGRAIAGTEVFVVDERGARVPPFVAGELCVAGAGVARGYLNRPEQTADKFVTVPGIEGLVYRTGDKARFLATGELEYLGRIDEQVKIRGHRVEPMEVEQLLLRCPGVHEAHVLASSIGGGPLELVAYVVGIGPTETVSLRDTLRRSLPEYLVPTRFVSLTALPLTANGKVDRKALPEPWDRNAPRAAIVAPRDAREEAIAAVFRDVLGVNEISIEDSFFDLGGHSLKAMQAVGLLRRALGVGIKLREFMSAATVANIATLAQGAATTGPLVIPRIPEQDHYELSSAQRRLWALERMDDLGSAFNMAAAFVFEGEFDSGAFTRSFARLVERHEPLRTSFHLIDGAPRQQIHEGAWVPVDLVDAPHENDEDEIRQIVRRTLSTRFYLEHGVLLKARLIRCSPTRYVFAFAMHHILGDGWAVAVLARELMHLYACEVKGEAPALPPLNVQYRDYASWQRASLEGPEMEQHARYWREKLSGEIPTLDLPSSKQRPAVKTYRGRTVHARLDRQTTAAMNALARQQGATLFMVLVAAVKALLFRYTGQEDILVGTVVAGREHPDLEHLLGICINLVVLRDSVQGDRSFEAHVGAVQKTVAEALDHAAYPFDRLVDELAIERDVSRSPLFDILVVLQNTEAPTLAMDGVKVSPYPMERATSVYDMSFEFAEEDGELVLDLQYNTDLFDVRTIDRLTAHWGRLVKGLLADPSAPIHAAPMLSDAEITASIVGGGVAHAQFKHATLTGLFEKTIAERSQELAVISGDVQLTYAELSRHADLVAQTLVSSGPLPDATVVAVLLPRDERLPAAFLGVLRAGAIYLPIDADYPVERATYMLRDSGASVVITHGPWIERLSGEPSLRLLDIADAAAESPVSRVTSVRSRVASARKADDVAALIYTSGSTGNPKGVMMEHRGLVNTTLEFNRWCDITRDSRVLQFASISFDAALLEMSMAFVSGGVLVIAARDFIDNTARFTEYLTRSGVTFGILPPVYLRTLERHPLPTMQTLVTAGEAPDSDLARYYARQKRYINAYGPAECSICVSMYIVDPDADYSAGVPIGTPLLNTQAVITDAALNPLPVGSVGELCALGIGVSRGYIGQPTLTAEKFVDHPNLGRIYRTGDLARIREDGTIEFAGRRDDQIKIRGQRVEPEEVRRRLLAHEVVEAAAVIDRQASHGGKELVAFVVTTSPISSAELRRWLGATLTPAMVPAAIGFLDRIPLTSNGKIDKKALRKLPIPQEGDADETEQRPMTEIESALAEAFAEVLELSRVKLSDNYFALGGDSIKAIRIASRLRQKGFGLEVKQIFTHPTVAELSGLVSREESRLDQGPAIGPVALGPIHRWFASRMSPERRGHFNNSVMLGSAEGAPLSEAVLRKALAAVVRFHDSLRLCWFEAPGRDASLHYGDVRVADEVAEALRVVDLRGASAWRERLETEAEAMQRSMDLERGHIVRALLARTPAGDRLLLVVHHIGIDAVSWRIFVEDLASAYQQAAADRPIELAAKTDSFAVWSQRMWDYPESDSGVIEREYWDAVEQKVNSIPRLGRGEQRGRNRDSATVAFSLDVASTSLLMSDANSAYTTQPTDIMLAALARAFLAWKRFERTAIALEGHGREPDMAKEVDVSRTIGWFTSLYPVVLEVAESADIGHHLVATKETIHAIPNNGASYGVLRHTHGVPGLGGASGPQVSFNFLGDSGSGSYPAPFARATEPTGTDFSPDAERLFDIDFLLTLAGGHLRVDIDYDASRFNPSEMRELADHYHQEILSIVQHCMGREVTTLTPSDVDYQGLTIEDLSRILEAVGG